MNRRVKIGVVVALLIIPLAFLGINALSASNITMKVLSMTGKEVNDDKLSADVVVQLSNEGQLPLSILGGKLCINILNKKFVTLELPIIYLSPKSSKNVTILTTANSITLILENNSIKFKIEGIVNAPMPITVYYEHEQDMSYDGKGYKLIDVWEQDKGVLKAEVMTKLPMEVHGLEANVSINVISDGLYPLNISAGDIVLDGTQIITNMTIYLGNNESMSSLIRSQVCEGSNEILANVKLTVYKSSWFFRIIANFTGSQDNPLPNWKLERVDIDILNEKVTVYISFENKYSIEVKIIKMNFSVIAQGYVIANGWTENQVINPKSESVIKIDTTVVEENITKLSGIPRVIYVNGFIIIHIAEVNYWLPICLSKTL